MNDNDDNSHPGLGVVLLAAGSASRMGNRPKCLLELAGVPLIRRACMALSGADELLVVLGHYADQIEPALRGLPVTLAHNPEPDAGQDASLRLGLRRLSPGITSVMVALADQPLIGPQDVVDLMAAFHARPEGRQLVRPWVDGLPGNPVVFTRSVCDQILAAGGPAGCRQWQATHPEAVHHWETTNPHYRVDVDSPEDLAVLAARTGHRLRWPDHLTGPH